MGSEPLATRIEVWPVAGDSVGLWLLSPDAWRPDLPVMADSDPHGEVEMLLASHGVRPDGEGAVLAYLHSTSWRHERSGLVVTYVAVVAVAELVLDEWPDAQPITLHVAERVGPPAPHASTGRPDPRRIDVLMHGLGHLRDQLDKNVNARRDIPEVVQRHLELLEPTLAGMYDVEFPAAA